MRRVIWLDSAVNDVVRLHEFMASKNPTTAHKVVQSIRAAATRLEQFPDTGKPVSNLPDYRDLAIRFGSAGYFMRYRLYQDNVYIVHLRHYRELGFK